MLNVVPPYDHPYAYTPTPTPNHNPAVTPNFNLCSILVIIQDRLAQIDSMELPGDIAIDPNPIIFSYQMH